MPDFDVITIGGAQVPWVDEPSANPVAPTRINPDPAHLHSYRQIIPPAVLEFECIVGGVTAPLDSDPVMAGRTFTADWAEYSGDVPPSITQAAGQSSAITVTLLASHIGHFLLGVTLSDGVVTSGCMGVPFDAETA